MKTLSELKADLAIQKSLVRKHANRAADYAERAQTFGDPCYELHGEKHYRTRDGFTLPDLIEKVVETRALVCKAQAEADRLEREIADYKQRERARLERSGSSHLYICGECCETIKSGFTADLVHVAAVRELHRCKPGETLDRTTRVNLAEREKRKNDPFA